MTGSRILAISVHAQQKIN